MSELGVFGDRSLLILALTNLFAGCMGLLVILTGGYSPVEAAKSAIFLGLGIHLGYKHRHE
ncbi:MAG: hypothetical protein J07HQX50_00246 [Haloquadratum sp. J07HQX50]|jgi:hypothetical protein|nr:MAG: hypothetical protein J07HQX50_00246 [Haloquadratum sp. J07HQX50]